METVVNVMCLVWAVLVIAVGAVVLAGIALVGALLLAPIFVFLAAFA